MSRGEAPSRPKRTQPRCPACGKPVPWEGNPWRPFCSERCKTQDLAAWASEDYTIPSEDSPGSDEGEGR